MLFLGSGKNKLKEVTFAIFKHKAKQCVALWIKDVKSYG